MTLNQVANRKLTAEIAWASGSFATGTLFNGMALFSLYFMTSYLGIAPAIAGLVIFSTKLFDAVLDPLMGAISDRTRHRWGPRRIYLLIGGLMLGLSFAAFFNQPSAAGVGAIVSGLLILTVYSAAYTIFSVPYLAMPPEMVSSYDGRTKLMSLRVFFLLGGVTAGSAGGPLIVAYAGGGIGGYKLMGMLFGGLATAICLFSFFGTGLLPVTPIEAPREKLAFKALILSPVHDVAAVFGNAPFRLLTLVKLCQLAVLSTVLACTPYFFTLVLAKNTAEISKYLFTFSISGIVALPLCRKIIAMFGKKEAYIFLLVLYALGLSSWFLWVPTESMIFFYARAIGIGVVSTATLLCALSMLPDTMEYDRLISGRSRDGVISGVFTLVEKVAGACGPLVVGVLLQSFGMNPSRAPGIVQPESAILAIRMGTSLAPALLCLIALPFLLSYSLDEARLERARLGHF